MKITFMGAGSTVFARNVIGDCMCSEILKNSEFALYDIDPKRLKESESILRAINKEREIQLSSLLTAAQITERPL